VLICGYLRNLRSFFWGHPQQGRLAFKQTSFFIFHFFFTNASTILRSSSICCCWACILVFSSSLAVCWALMVKSNFSLLQFESAYNRQEKWAKNRKDREIFKMRMTTFLDTLIYNCITDYGRPEYKLHDVPSDIKQTIPTEAPN